MGRLNIKMSQLKAFTDSIQFIAKSQRHTL